MQLGMVGLGRMGSFMVQRLMRDGHECVVYDRDPKPGQATLSPFFAPATTRSQNAPMVRSASALETFADFATLSTSSALVMGLLSNWPSSSVARW
mgnify:CR=1 FL=1